MSIITDNTVLIHIHSGFESKNKVTLGLLVALEAEKNDHKVSLFLAGDGVNGLIQSLGLDGLETENHFDPKNDDIADWFSGSPDWVRRS